jgi:hypothetical protein
VVSEEIRSRRDLYLEIMHAHGVKERGEIVRSVDETQQQLLAVLRGAQAEEAQRKPAPEEWSLRELAMHAAFAERLIAKFIHYLARGNMPPLRTWRVVVLA